LSIETQGEKKLCLLSKGLVEVFLLCHCFVQKSTKFPYLSLMKFTLPSAKGFDNQGGMVSKDIKNSIADKFSSSKKINIERDIMFQGEFITFEMPHFSSITICSNKRMIQF
jgi:hypothetical protein